MRFPAIAKTLLATAVVSATAIGQARADDPVKLTLCANSHRSGRRIVSNFGIVEFYVPRFAKTRRVTDVDYVEYFVRYGPERDRFWLKIMFGGLVGGDSPRALRDTSIRWTAHTWGCPGRVDGTDWSGIGSDGRRWRHIKIPFGFASYERVSAKAAGYFDKILHTMCCGSCPNCKY